MMPTRAPLPSAAIRALEQGRLVEAIKAVRQNDNSDPLAALLAIQTYLAANPAASARCRSAMAAASAGVRRVAISALVVGAAVVAYLTLAGKF